MKTSSHFFNQPLCELHSCLWETIRMCHLAGFFPFDDFSSWNTSLRSRRKNIPYLIFNSASLIGQIMVTGFSVLWFFLNTVSLITMSYTIFYLTGLIAALLLLKLANNWEKLIKKALEIENSLLEIRNMRRDLWKYRLTTYVFMSLALVEHIMSIVFKISKTMVEINEYNITEKMFEDYFTNSVPFIFNFISYSTWKAVLFVIINLQSTFIWNITDVMTMCVSLYLTSFFHDFNHIIHSRDHHVRMSLNWEKIRVFYSQLVALVKEVDLRFCYLVLLSFFTNMFFICLQFFYTLNYGMPKQNNWTHKNHRSSFHSTIHLIYYVYSFGFLLTRACAMCLLAANVHKAAEEPQYVIGNVPAAEYTLTVQRFNRQVKYTTTALSGVYFYITRSTLLKVAGTFLTYELVLLQFDIENGLQINDNKSGIYDYWNYTFIY